MPIISCDKDQVIALAHQRANKLQKDQAVWQDQQQQWHCLTFSLPLAERLADQDITPIIFEPVFPGKYVVTRGKAERAEYRTDTFDDALAHLAHSPAPWRRTVYFVNGHGERTAYYVHFACYH